MKKGLISLMLLLCTAFATYAQGAAFSLDRVRHEFGDLPSGKTYTTTFTVTSMGVSPLVLIDATTGCKCTKASFPKKPLRKGEKAVITVTFDATEVGFFDKQIAVRTNAAEKMVFRVTGNVLIE